MAFSPSSTDIAAAAQCLSFLVEKGAVTYREAGLLRSLLRTNPHRLQPLFRLTTSVLLKAAPQHPAVQLLRGIALEEAEKRFIELFSFVNDEELKLLSRRERSAKNALSDATLTYGEPGFTSFDSTLRQAGGLAPGSVFLDLGHGAGKAALACALLTDVSCILGYELLEGLHAVACEAVRRFTAMMERDGKEDALAGIAPSVSLPLPVFHLRLGSFTDPAHPWCVPTGEVRAALAAVGKAVPTAPLAYPAITFANSTCFSDPLMSALATRAARDLPPSSCLITYTRPVEHAGLECVHQAKLQQSWGAASVFVHKVLGSLPSSPAHSGSAAVPAPLPSMPAPQPPPPPPAAAAQGQRLARPSPAERPQTAHPSRRRRVGQGAVPPPSIPWSMSSPSFVQSTRPPADTTTSPPLYASALSYSPSHGTSTAATSPGSPSSAGSPNDGLYPGEEEVEEAASEEEEEGEGADDEEDRRAVYGYATRTEAVQQDRRAVYGTSDDEEGEGAFSGAAGAYAGLDSDEDEGEDDDGAQSRGTRGAVIAPATAVGGRTREEDEEEEEGEEGEGGSDDGTAHGSAAATAGDRGRGAPASARRVRIGPVHYREFYWQGGSEDQEEEEDEEEEEGDEEGEDVGAPETVGQMAQAGRRGAKAGAGSNGGSSVGGHSQGEGGSGSGQVHASPSTGGPSASSVVASMGSAGSEEDTKGGGGLPSPPYPPSSSASVRVVKPCASSTGTGEEEEEQQEEQQEGQQQEEERARESGRAQVDDGAADDNPVAIAAAAAAAAQAVVRRAQPIATTVVLSPGKRGGGVSRGGTGGSRQHLLPPPPASLRARVQGEVVARQLGSAEVDLWADDEDFTVLPPDAPMPSGAKEGGRQRGSVPPHPHEGLSSPQGDMLMAIKAARAALDTSQESYGTSTSSLQPRALLFPPAAPAAAGAGGTGGLGVEAAGTSAGQQGEDGEAYSLQDVETAEEEEEEEEGAASASYAALLMMDGETSTDLKWLMGGGAQGRHGVKGQAGGGISTRATGTVDTDSRRSSLSSAQTDQMASEAPFLPLSISPSTGGAGARAGMIPEAQPSPWDSALLSRKSAAMHGAGGRGRSSTSGSGTEAAHAAMIERLAVEARESPVGQALVARKLQGQRAGR